MLILTLTYLLFVVCVFLFDEFFNWYWGITLTPEGIVFTHYIWNHPGDFSLKYALIGYQIDRSRNVIFLEIITTKIHNTNYFDVFHELRNDFYWCFDITSISADIFFIELRTSPSFIFQWAQSLHSSRFFAAKITTSLS